MDYLIFVVALLIGLGLGNALGDQATLRDCAVKGEARMVSGGNIKCEVKKEAPDANK